ncbi:hypothetical protein GON01_02795 [Sphingomonas sp. MAH-20]|uniref:Integrase catalytic domain-containing protein n=1 Tax=Sphingomonas horti TaxID=2682842 RepID=A0A6I4IXR6_9SPHN|nr:MULTISPECIES: hypothetical protein [Sphingomonas]MBA2920880.1 hypothetical protein [Sphingomonas sp. CGMCC 1.13658]MVO76866.1 hypothetical protein [Sphingomonas horti]
MSNFDIYASLKPGSELVYKRTSYFLTTRTPDRRFMAISSTGLILTMPDPESGLPAFPTVAMMRAAQASRELVIRSDPLDDPVRAEARAEEASAEEIEARDSWAPLRRKVLKAWEMEPDDDLPALSDSGLTTWFLRAFDKQEVIARFGRVPCGTTLRTWIKKRGRRGDRRAVDAESRSGRVPRRRKAHQIVVNIGRLHAVAVEAITGRTQKTGFKLFKRDVARASRGQPVEVNGVKLSYEKPAKPLKPYGREIFRLECHRAKNGDTTQAAFGKKARQAEYRGGGVSKEPTRYLEIVEQDDTPFPKYFLIDLERRVPVGPATVVFSMDVFTRCFIGWDVSFESPSISTWMRAVAHGAEPKEVPKRYRESHPELADIFGYVVGAYVYDNALQNISKANEDAGGDLCHEVRLAGEGQPTHKNHVERGHQTVQSLMSEVPGSPLSVPRMRKYGYDPQKHVVVTIQEFRVLLAEAIAKYHLTPSEALNWRCPLDVWTEQMSLHGHSQARDLDQFLRSIGDVDYVPFGRTGCRLHGLKYSDGQANESLLADFAHALGPAEDTEDPTYRVKVKSYTDDIGFVSVWNPHTRRYVDVPCTKRRYASGKPRWLHERTLEHAAAMGADFYGKTPEEVEEALIELEAGFIDDLKAAMPEAAARERQTMARLIDAPNVRRYLGDAVSMIRVQPSPSGMESLVEHELRSTIRRDAMVEPQRRRRGSQTDRDSRDAGGTREIADAATRRTPPRHGSRGSNRAAGEPGSRPRPKRAEKSQAAGAVKPLSTSTFK